MGLFFVRKSHFNRVLNNSIGWESRYTAAKAEREAISKENDTLAHENSRLYEENCQLRAAIKTSREAFDTAVPLNVVWTTGV